MSYELRVKTGYKKHLILIVVIILFLTKNAHAGNLGFGVHSGYGVLKYKENTSAFGTKVESESKQNVVLFGVSGEYSLPRQDNFYIALVTDWALGLEGTEKWRENNVQVQTNDMEVFGQFYDLRFGYKDTLDSFYYRFYAGGGWDGLHFKRDRFVSRGVSLSGSVTEDFSLWRTGGGIGLGFKQGKWALDGRFAYAYYPKGEVENSSLPQFTFDTNGTCTDAGLGIAYEVWEKTSLYLGGSYTLLKLDQSDIMRSGSIQAVFPESETEIIAGVVNLTYSF